MAKTKLLLIVEVDEDALQGVSPYGELPDRLWVTVAKLLPTRALELTKVFLGNPKINVDKAMAGIAIDYHHYTVSVRGEACRDKDCEQHQHRNVFNLHDHRHRCSSPPGIN
jgi:hypothetical protein